MDKIAFFSGQNIITLIKKTLHRFLPNSGNKCGKCGEKFACKVWLSISDCQEVHFTQNFIRIARRM